MTRWRAFQMRSSLLTCSAPARVACTLLPLALLWGAVAWAMAAA